MRYSIRQNGDMFSILDKKTGKIVADELNEHMAMELFMDYNKLFN